MKIIFGKWVRKSLRAMSFVLFGSLLYSTAGPLVNSFAITPTAPSLSWSSSTIAGANGFGPAIATSADGSVVFIASRTSSHLSTHYGDSFTTITALANKAACNWNMAAAMSANGQKIFWGDSQKIIYSWDGGSTWTETSIGGTTYKCIWGLHTSSDGTKVIAGLNGGGYAYSTDSGAHWNYVETGNRTLTDISADGTKIFIAVLNSIPQIGSIGGTFTNVNLPSGYGMDWRGVSCDSTCTHLLIASASGATGGIFVSSDSGLHWRVGEGANANFRTYVWAGLSSNSDGSRLAAGVDYSSGAGIYVSTDYGATWTQQSPGGEFDGIAIASTGSAIYAQNNANPLTFSRAVFQTATTTTLAISNTSSAYGQVDTLTATISSTSAAGTVNFKNNGVSITGCGAVSVNSGSAVCAFSSLSVGTYTNKIMASYSGGGNYAASDSGFLAPLTITQALLNVLPTATSVAFGGTPTYAKTYSGFVNNDTITSTSFTTGLTPPTCVAASFTTSTSVSSSPLSITCSGGSSTNYTFTYASTANLTITQATPTVSLALSAATPTYGSIDTITATASMPGAVDFKVGGVSISGCGAVSTATSSPYTAQCLWIPGAASTSYSLTATLAPTNTVDYTSANSATTSTSSSSRAAITVTPTAGQSKVYGANNPTLTYSITSGALVGSDVLTGALSYTGTNVGSYPITIGTLANSNYTITLASVNFGITQATQAAVTLSSLSAAYNPNNKTVSLTASGGSGTGSYTYALDASNTTAGCAVNTATLTYTTAGTCVIAVTRSSDTNYLARTDAVSFTIGLASQTITFGSLSAKSYSSDTFTVSATSSASLTVVFTSGSPTICTTSGTSGSTITLLGVGTCVINANQAGDANTSAASQVSQNFTVNPRAITVTADAKSKSYGASDPTLTYTITTSSLIVGDALTGALSRATGSDAGTYQIQQGALTSANNPKYAITFVAADLTITRITPTLVLTYPNSNVAILRPGATDTPTVTTSSSSGSLTFATTAASSICTVDSSTGVISLFGAGSCPVAMTTAQTTNYIQYTETTTVTIALLSTSLTGISQSNLVSMGNPFYAHASIDQSYSFSSGSNGASVAIPAGALDASVPISIHLLADSTDQRTIIGGSGTSVLSVVVSWVASDGSVPNTNTGKAISVTLTNPSIKSGAKIYSIIGNQSTLLGTATADGSVTSLITEDPVLLVINPVVTTPAPSSSSSSSGGGGYVMAVAVDNSAAIEAANLKLAADKAAAELKAAQEKKAAEEAEAAAIKAAKELVDAQAQAAAELKASQDKATQELRIAEELRLAQLQAAQDLKAAAAKKAAADIAAAARAMKPAVTLYSVSSTLKLSTYDSAYLAKYVKSLKNGAAVTCIGYTYGKNPASQASQTLAKRQANAVCTQMKKTNKTLKTSIVIYPASKAPKAAAGAKWVGVSYRIDGFKASDNL